MTATLLTAAGAHAASSEPPVIEVLSNRADLVSGGDALVQVKVPAGVDARDVTVKLDGRDITHQFAIRPNGRYEGLVTGLREGTNELTAHLSKNSGAKLTVTNRSRQGPIFAGRQVQPWICETEKFELGPPSGPQCMAPTRYDYFYKSTATNSFNTYDPASPPLGSLIASTTTDEGKTVPYIVRRKRGVMDRGIYDIAVLFDPKKERTWSPWSSGDAWNGKLHLIFVGSGSPGHRQGGPYGVPNVLDAPFVADVPLSRGFAVATSTLLVGLNNMNDIVAAESVMMLKEHVTETYGQVRQTTSSGESGGSALQRLVAANYPGLLDGIMPLWSIPDLQSMFSLEFTDCPLIYHYFNEASPSLWADPAARRAVVGMGSISCEQELAADAVGGLEDLFDPRMGCTTTASERRSGANETEWVYDPEINSDGVRCTVVDHNARAFGYRALDGFANNPTDNVGVQYGLLALVRGQITPTQFIDLNRNVGGRDIDYVRISQRAQGDIEGLRNAYRSGRIPDYRQLAKVPMMEVRSALNEEIHQSLHGQMARERLIKANGHSDNQVIWETASPLPGSGGTERAVFTQAFTTLDEWVTGIINDPAIGTLEERVLRNRPSTARDTCWVAGKPGLCGDRMPAYANPRIVAGGPVSSDVLKCQLKPIVWKDYGSVQFTDDQKQQLQEAFPGGVCDWSEPGVGQQPVNGPWQSLSAEVGGEPLGPEPKSVPVKGKP